jgi:glycosyltransferase involved in cell wall biosynthesis
MRIVLAASIYPPEVGGPSAYAKELKEALERQGHSVGVVTYGALKRLPSGIRHVWYAARLLFALRRTDAVIAFDTYSGGLPALLACSVTRASLVIRIGGDFVWEQYLERTKESRPLPDFYAHMPQLSWKERIIFTLSKFVVHRAQAVFSSEWQRDLWRVPYELDSAGTSVIENALLPIREPRPHQRKNFVLLGRQIMLKNVDAFRRAFSIARQRHTDIELDEGILPRSAYLEKLATCYAIAVPSISDITPQSILEAIRAGKPFLLTKYSAYAERFKEYGVIVDPLNEADMQRGIERLADPVEYERLRASVATFDEVRSYEDIANEFVSIIERL